jgi:hypothetical protein
LFGRDKVIQGSLRERFVVTLSSGEGSFAGLLMDADDRTLTFEDVRLVATDGTVPADGRLYVDRLNIAYMQRVVLTGSE